MLVYASKQHLAQSTNWKWNTLQLLKICKIESANWNNKIELYLQIEFLWAFDINDINMLVSRTLALM